MKILASTALACALAFGTLFPAQGAEPVDINTATAAALADAISGVGLKRAEAIVRYREMNGPFVDVEGLLAVQGIGPKTLDRSRDRLTVR
jgi:competence protein ComEA